MRSVDVHICTGTTCFVMGGADILLLEDTVSEELEKYGISREEMSRRLTISGNPCTGHCRHSKLKPPFVIVNGELIAEADLQKVMDRVILYLLSDTMGSEVVGG